MNYVYEKYAGSWVTREAKSLLSLEQALNKIRESAASARPDVKTEKESTWLGVEAAKLAVLSPTTRTPTAHRYIVPVRVEKRIRPLFCNVNPYA